MKTKLLLIFLFFYSLISICQVANNPGDLNICDDNVDGDATNGFVQNINLDVLTPAILGSQNPDDFAVSYHSTQADADADANPLPNTFSNTTPNQQTIYVRVTENSTGNFSTTSFDIIIHPIPITNSADNIEECDDDLDGFASFDLTLRNETILNGQVNIELTYYLSLTDAQANINPIVSPFTNTVANSQTIFIRLSNIVTNCFNTTSFDIITKSCSTADDDNDNVPDDKEDVNRNGNLEDDDTDNNMTPNYKDNDDDGDGVLTKDEDYNNNGDPTDDDTNNNNIPDYLDSAVALSIQNYQTINFTTYPNPINNFLNIELSNSVFENINAAIYNVLGSKILTKKITSQKTNIDISNLSSGIYLLKIGNSEKTATKKIVKN